MLRFLAVLVSTLLLTPPLAAAEGPSREARLFQLEVGDAARRARQAPVVLDALSDTATGELIGPGDLAPRLAGVSILFVGESHTNADFHAVQLRVIEELVRAGRPVRIGLEMYPYTEQQWLDAWSAGQLTEEGFLSLSRWYENWGYPWAYYREILLLARDRALPVYGLNAPREVVASVRKKGFKDLTPEEAAHIPTSVVTSSPDHRTLFRAFFEGDDDLHSSMSEEQWEGMFAAQCTWDATMGFQAVKALRARPQEGAILVVLIGSGHVAYGLGIERQARQWWAPAEGRMASLIPVPIRTGEGETVPTVRASYADFLWGVPPEGEPLYPALGLSTVAAGEGKGRRVVFIEKDSPAAAAGFEEGDQLLTFDGLPLPDKETFNRLMAAKRWGDRVVITVQRGAETKTLEAWLRRTGE
ncbi:MAG TPA: ChaN family lipoprotein [Thermoanaerobaculia bacterium]|nr:ChaN family lipoprotein [Thermoanaerobaculia bacterium]